MLINVNRLIHVNTLINVNRLIHVNRSIPVNRLISYRRFEGSYCFQLHVKAYERFSYFIVDSLTY